MLRFRPASVSMVTGGGPDADIKLKTHKQCHRVEIQPDKYHYQGPYRAIKLVVLAEKKDYPRATGGD